MQPEGYLIPAERIEGAILEIRGKKVMLDRELAALYGVSVKAFNQAVRRNLERFPDDFMFQLTWEEVECPMSRSATSDDARSRSQSVTLKRGGNIKYRPYAFTEHGAVMAATILNSPRAIEVSVFVVRAFVRLSRAAADQRQFALKLAELETRLASHDKNFQAVFGVLRRLVQTPEPKRRRIGFVTTERLGGTDSDFVVRDHPRRRGRN